MPEFLELKIIPGKISDEYFIREQLFALAGPSVHSGVDFKLVRKSIDSRKGRVLYVLRYEIVEKNHYKPPSDEIVYRPVHQDAPRVLIIGAGPCGYYAALRCIELGLRPIVIDRGKDVQARRRDLKSIQQFGIVNPDSNYCFGEGGAGTYSDGKLYTRSTKRGDIIKALKILVQHGAAEEILTDAHPHIGSNKLPKIVAGIRETIINAGGEVRFNSRVIDFIIENNVFRGVVLEDGSELTAGASVLCTGHSARDIYELCHKYNISIAFKPFAMGVRIEHPQALIDEIQYHREQRGEHLPAASYGLACQVNEHGVFSFCMCPGGLIVPASTSPGELVVNGMSLSRRDSPYANAALVVSLDQNPGKDVFDGMHYQSGLEKHIFSFGDGTQQAPAQRITDFVKNKISADLPSSSYIPGVYSAPMHEFLPGWIAGAIRKALHEFDKKMKGYFTSEAQLVGLESRTSAPIRINRDRATLMSTTTEALFPGGEGAGFAGGILSAALDGERLANAVNAFITR